MTKSGLGFREQLIVALGTPTCLTSTASADGLKGTWRAREPDVQIVEATLMQSPRSRGWLKGAGQAERAALTLSVTGLVVNVTLFAWLLGLAIVVRPGPELQGAWVAFPKASPTWLGFPREDLRAVVGGAAEGPVAALDVWLHDQLARGSTRPLVLYLSAAGSADTHGAGLLRPHAVDLGSRSIAVEDLVERLQEAAARRKVLLLLDTGQAGPDRSLGSFGNGFLAAFQARLEGRPTKGLAVLSACAPGQTSWSSEADRCSVFAYYVTRGLAGAAEGWDDSSPRVTVTALSNYVRHHVERWVRVERGATQTPVFLGDLSVNFVLPRPSASREREVSSPEEGVKSRLDRLMEEWSQHERMRMSRPFRRDPGLWRDYQFALLRAERTWLAGEEGEADTLLASLPARRQAIPTRSTLPPPVTSWSLALREKERTSPSSKSEDGADEEVSLRTTLDKITGRASADGPETQPPQGELPELVEAQLLRWALTFIDGIGDTTWFHGRRGERLQRAYEMRRLAERAAAPDSRVDCWVAPLVEEGDARRRRAQDALFVSDPATLDSFLRLLDEAKSFYDEAIQTGQCVAEALDLVEKVEAEAPYYGEWQARRDQGASENGLGTDMVDLLRDTEALADLVQASPSGRSSDEVGRATVLERVAAIQGPVRATLERIRSAFDAESEALANATGRSQWRAIDAVLRVPVMPPERRRRLLEKLRSETVAGHLDGPSGQDSPPVRGRLPADLGTTTSDPLVWREARSLAHLELGLLAIGGVPETSLRPFGEALAEAEKALKENHPDLFRRWAIVGDRSRNARRNVAALPGARAGDMPDLASALAADRAYRLTSWADPLGPAITASREAEKHRTQERLLWHAQRLLEDFDTERARRLLEAVRRLGDTKAIADALTRSTEMDRGKLVVAAEHEGPVEVLADSVRPFGVKLGGHGPIPQGQATLLVTYDPSLPLTVAERTSLRDSREGVLVDLGGLLPSGPRATNFEVARTEPGPLSVETDLVPRAFYRGRFAQAVRGMNVTLTPAEDPVSIAIRQSYKALKGHVFKKVSDQFLEHPGQGFLHYGTWLQYKLVLTSAKSLRVVVRYGLKEQPESWREQEVGIEPGRPVELDDMVKADDLPIERDAKALVLPPRTLEVLVTQGRASGRKVGQAKFTFHTVLPQDYMDVKSEFDPQRRLLLLRVVHLASDKVTVPVKVVASIGGETQMKWVERAGAANFTFPVPLGLPKVQWRVGVENLPNAFSEVVDTPPLVFPEPGKNG